MSLLVITCHNQMVYHQFTIIIQVLTTRSNIMTLCVRAWTRDRKRDRKWSELLQQLHRHGATFPGLLFFDVAPWTESSKFSYVKSIVVDG